MKILIADDNPHNRYLLEQLLTLSGHEVASATQGVEALAALRSQPCDAIITDILMPVMDGFQLCREVKADPALAAIPVIFYTATYTEPADNEFGLELGATAYLVKPVEPEVLIETLMNAVSAPPKHGRTMTQAATDDAALLTHYNARLVHKLESKMVELEQANTSLLKTNLALSHEIDRRRAAEKMAQDALELQRATLESTIDGVLAVDADGTIVTTNRSLRQIWQLPVDQPVTGKFPALLQRLTRDAHLSVDAAAAWRAESVAPMREECEILKLTDGRIVERRSRPLLTSSGRNGRVWTFRDVTQQRQSDDARRSLQAQLFEMQKMEALGVLAGGIAHDFNNILTIILGQTAIGEDLLPMEHPARDALRNVAVAGTRATDLVRQILTFSRQQEPERQMLAPEEVVAQTIKLMQSSLPATVRIVTEFDEHLPRIRADRTQLHQVLTNLASNAEQAMEGRGTLTFVLRKMQVPGDGPPELRPGAYVQLAVRDTGPGIDERVIHRLFEPFFTTKPAGRGTGLGLAVVHGIVTSYGGSIRVRSEPGKGAEFQIYLPAASDVLIVPEKPATNPAELRNGDGEQVLLAEDNGGVREYVAALLDRLNYRVTACDSGESALEKFRAQPDDFSLVLTDLTMTGMSGTELAREVRQVRADIPVIIMTGYFSSTELDQASGTLQFELLLKPCTATSLSEAVFRTLSLSR